MTRLKTILFLAWAPFLVGIVGCRKSEPRQPAPPAAAVAPQASAAPGVTLRVHWQGKGKMSADPDASNLLKIWDLPETIKLQAHALDKLSAAPSRILLGQTNENAAKSLRPLLDDVVAQECYLEVRQATNAAGAPDEIVFSVRLDTDRANLWQTNFTAMMESLTGAAPATNSPARWILKSKAGSNMVEFTRAGEWTVLSMAQDHSALLDDTLARIRSQRTPVVASSANAFLDGFIDLARIGTEAASNALPKISFAMKFDKGSVDTTGELLFSGGQQPPLEAWKIPTNWISASAISITAVRGFAPWLRTSTLWTNLNAGPPPNQCFIWATREYPMQTYFAAPIADASNAAARISEVALRKQGPGWLTNALAGFQKSKNSAGLSWRGFPYIAPFLRSASYNGENFLIGGFFDVDMPAGPPPDGVVSGILAKTNLVYWDRELSGHRVGQWIQLGQAIRFASGAGQLPGDSASFQWLRAMGSRLGTCGTEITQAAPGKLSFARKSDLGFSAIELHLLADWLESPEFPRGTYSLLVRAPAPPPL